MIIKYRNCTIAIYNILIPILFYTYLFYLFSLPNYKINFTELIILRCLN